MDKKMLEWAPFVVPFFSYGGLDVVIGYQLISDLRSSSSLLTKLFVVLAYMLIVALFTFLGFVFEHSARKMYITTSLLVAVIALVVALFCPSLEFAANLSLAGIVIGMIYIVTGSTLFFRRIKK